MCGSAKARAEFGERRKRCTARAKRARHAAHFLALPSGSLRGGHAVRPGPAAEKSANDS